MTPEVQAAVERVTATLAEAVEFNRPRAVNVRKAIQVKIDDAETLLSALAVSEARRGELEARVADLTRTRREVIEKYLGCAALNPNQEGSRDDG